MITKPQPITFDFDENEITPAYRPYIDAPEAIQLIIGNTGSAKSGFFYRKAVIYCLCKKYFRLIFTRKIKDTIRDSIFLGIKDVINDWGLKKYFTINESQMDFVCKINDNRMLSFGLDDPAKLKSIKDPSHWFWDEFDESDQEDFAEIRRRLRTKKVRQTQFWGALNPVAGWWGKEYFFPEEYHEIIPLGRIPANTDNTLILKTSYKQNPFVDPVEMEQKNRELAILDENNWTVYEEGNWGRLTTGGEFYSKYKRRLHVGKVDYIPGLADHLTYDFNVLPYMTLLLGQIRRYNSYYDEKNFCLVEITGPNVKPVTVFEVRIVREYCFKDPRNSTQAVTEQYKADFGHHSPDVLFYGDAMGNKRHEGTGNETEFKKIKELLARFIDDSSNRSWRKNPSVLATREFVNKILAGVEIASGVVIILIIDASCTELIKDMENVKLGADGKLKQKFTDKKTKQQYELYGHTSDALNYLITKAFEQYFKLAK